MSVGASTPGKPPGVCFAGLIHHPRKNPVRSKGFFQKLRILIQSSEKPDKINHHLSPFSNQVKPNQEIKGKRFNFSVLLLPSRLRHGVVTLLVSATAPPLCKVKSRRPLFLLSPTVIRGFTRSYIIHDIGDTIRQKGSTIIL